MNGIGEWTFTDGSKRRGTFKNDEENGISIQINADLTKEIQIWINGT